MWWCWAPAGSTATRRRRSASTPSTSCRRMTSRTAHCCRKGSTTCSSPAAATRPRPRRWHRAGSPPRRWVWARQPGWPRRWRRGAAVPHVTCRLGACRTICAARGPFWSEPERAHEGDDQMIIDSHAHVSPNYDRFEDWDFDTERELWAYHQSTNYFHHKPVAMTARGEESTEAWKLLWDEQDAHSWSGRKDVSFRISGAQFVWDKGGERYAAPMKPGLPAG